MTERGYYSIIQYVPDQGRAEGANVGLVVICPATGGVHVAMSPNNQAPKKRFGAAAFDDVRLTIAKEALCGRLMRDLSGAPTLEALLRSRAREGNDLVLAEPRSVLVAGDVASLAESLCEELVFVRGSPAKAPRAQAPDVKWLLTYLKDRNAAIEQPGEVIVPVIQEPLKVTFAYVNGAHHFVRSQAFSSDRHAALSQAKDVGAQGRLLYHHSSDSLRRKLVVLTSVANTELSVILRELLSDMDVRLVHENEFQAFAEEVIATAHPVDH